MYRSCTLMMNKLSLGVVVNPLSDFTPESISVVPKVVSCLDVERILEVGEVREETVEAPDDVLDSPGGRPAQAVQTVGSEEGETDVAVN